MNTILLTGATASMRGGKGYAAFASAKFGLRAVAQSMARERGPKNIHVAHVVIDGGNSFYKDDIRHARALADKGMHFVDVGTSGGVWGLERGYCMMIGGDKTAFDHLDPIFKTLAPGIGTIEKTPGRENRKSTAEEGYLYTGPAGSGHFVKMVHNGIEYGMMQAMAEGFVLARKAGISPSLVLEVIQNSVARNIVCSPPTRSCPRRNSSSPKRNATVMIFIRRIRRMEGF